MIDVQEITHLHAITVRKWHEVEIDNPYAGLPATVCQQHSFNFRLWHQEDIARSPNVDDSKIAEVKRNIDKLNQQRNDWIEKVDDCLTTLIGQRNIQTRPDAPINTETPGSAIDRLSIMALRIYHLNEQLLRQGVSSGHIAIGPAKTGDLHDSARRIVHSLAAVARQHRGRKSATPYVPPVQDVQ